MPTHAVVLELTTGMSETLSKSFALAERTRRFALSIIAMYPEIRRRPVARAMADQLLRSATGVAANYRAAQRARSRREFAARIGICVEEADEAQFWLDLLTEAGILSPQTSSASREEARQLTAIFTAAHRTARRPVRQPAEAQGQS